jgi:hypothetical protein
MGAAFLFGETLEVGFEAARDFGRAADFLAAAFGAVARFAFAFEAPAATERLFTDAFPAARRAPEVDRLNPLVAGLLILVMRR